jgi:hypothetical protein
MRYDVDRETMIAAAPAGRSVASGSGNSISRRESVMRVAAGFATPLLPTSSFAKEIHHDQASIVFERNHRRCDRGRGSLGRGISRIGSRAYCGIPQSHSTFGTYQHDWKNDGNDSLNSDPFLAGPSPDFCIECTWPEGYPTYYGSNGG